MRVLRTKWTRNLAFRAFEKWGGPVVSIANAKRQRRKRGHSRMRAVKKKAFPKNVPRRQHAGVASAHVRNFKTANYERARAGGQGLDKKGQKFGYSRKNATCLEKNLGLHLKGEGFAQFSEKKAAAIRTHGFRPGEGVEKLEVEGRVCHSGGTPFSGPKNRTD